VKKLLALLIILALSLTGCTAAEDSITVYTDGPLSITTDSDDYIVVGGAVDGEDAPVQLDETTHALVTLDNIDHEVHEGHCFYSYDVIDLGAGENRSILLITPVCPEAHFYWSVDFELEAKIEIYEGVTISGQPTGMPVYNRNRNSTNEATTTIYHTPTVTGWGTLILESQLSQGKKAGGAENAFNELILKCGSQYVMIISNQAVGNNVVSGKMIWCEHY